MTKVCRASRWGSSGCRLQVEAGTLELDWKTRRVGQSASSACHKNIPSQVLVRSCRVCRAVLCATGGLLRDSASADASIDLPGLNGVLWCFVRALEAL